MDALISALRLKQRTNLLSAADVTQLFADFDADIGASYVMYPVLDSDHHDAANLVAATAMPLRGADALHLAIARRIGATTVTLDKQMADAATDLSISVHFL